MSLGLNDLQKKAKSKKSPQQEFPVGAWAGKPTSARTMRPWSKQGPDSDVCLNQEWMDQHSCLEAGQTLQPQWLRFQEPLLRIEEYIVSVYGRSRQALRRFF